MVSRALVEAAFSTVEAANGVEALAAMSKSRFNVVMTDFNMPVMDGLEFIRSLREVAAYRFTPVIFLTTEIEESKKAQAREAGATAWIVKPFTSDKIISVVNRVVPGT